LTPVLAALLPRATALHLFTHSPPVAHHMLRYLAERIRRDAEFRALLGIQNTARRIYAFLHLMKKKQEGDVQVVEHPPTHQDVASMINTSRESVTRALLTLAQQGIVEKGTQKLIIVRPEALRRLAQGQAAVADETGGKQQ
jgi:CRP/FNR family cyclic AMP-dependent transcriptional regulator